MSVTTANKEKTPNHAPSVFDIPGETGMPVFGHTFTMLKDPMTFGTKMRDKYGDVYRSYSFFRHTVTMHGADANEFILMDKEKIFSSELGWTPYLGRLFPRGLMLLDFDEHKSHRHIMATAFKTGPMKGYLERLNTEMPKRIADWGKTGSFKFYDAIKKLSLDMATTVFLGLDPDSDSSKINQALTDMVSASMGIVRVPLPGTIMARGVKGRKFMIDFLMQEIPKRRGIEQSDIFTQLCNAEDDDGNSFSDQEIVDHMIFLWMAAHDTITSSVTTLVFELGKNPEWQDKLRDEIKSLGLNSDALPYEKVNDLILAEYAFKESLRKNPPVPGTPRMTVRDVKFKDHIVPKGTIVNVSALATHRDPDIWPEPDKFDPMRFSPEGGAKSRHRFAWVPFGGGAHMCVGLHFAYMQMKVIMAHLLPHYDIELSNKGDTKFQIMPLIKPVDGLPITLKARI